MRILHVEDNPVDADLLARALRGSGLPQAQGISLVRADCLAQARQQLQHGAGFDLVLLDLGLPDGSGLALLREIREQALPLAVVALTGRGDEGQAVAALKAGANDYLVKDLAFSPRLAATLDEVLQRFVHDPARQRHGLRVLYAEHHAADIDLTRRHFAAHASHIRLEVVGDSTEALRRLLGPAPGLPAAAQDRAGPYDVLMLDYRLTPDSGLELLQQLRTEHRLDIPVVIVTGHGSEPVATQALRQGASDYVVKHPHYLHGLPQTLENAFHRVVVERERALLRASEEQLRAANAALESRVQQRTAELAQARDEALRANRAKTDFLAGMSHELRTPMNAVLGFAQLLALDEQPPLTPRHRAYVQHIQQAGEHLMGLIGELLDLAGIEAGKLEVDLQAVTLAPLLHDCLGLVAPLAQAQQVALAALPEPLHGAQVLADVKRLRQVLLNLLGNAIKYNRPGGQVSLSLSPEPGHLRLCVTDTGPGIDLAQQARLFTAFERLDAARSGVPGAGIGLALSQRIARLMGAEIGLDSAPGHGSTFWLRLRRAPQPQAATPLRVQPPTTAA